MRITKSRLKQIIKEELAKVLVLEGAECPEGQAQYQYVMIDGELTDIDTLDDESADAYRGCIDHEEAHPGMSYDEFQEYVSRAKLI